MNSTNFFFFSLSFNSFNRPLFSSRFALSKMTRANEFENFLFSLLPFQFFVSIEDTRSKMNSINFSSFFLPIISPIISRFPFFQFARFIEDTRANEFDKFLLLFHPFPPIVSTSPPLPFSFLVLIYRFSPYREGAHKQMNSYAPGTTSRPGTVQFRDNVISCCWQPTTAAVSVIRKNVLPSLCQTSSFG